MKVYSIFKSIDGEVNWFGQGTQTTFLRLAGCNFSCPYCDSAYAQSNDDTSETSVPKVFDTILAKGLRKVTITGGEPMLQKEEVYNLTKLLTQNGFDITIETNGSIKPYAFGSYFVMDYKTPSSGMNDRMISEENFVSSLTFRDFVKFVINDEKDLNFAIWKTLRLINKGLMARVAFSPCIVPGEPEMRPEVILRELWKYKMYNVVINIQIHKVVSLREGK